MGKIKKSPNIEKPHNRKREKENIEILKYR